MGLERQLAQHRAILIDVAMRLFDQVRPEEVRPRRRRARSAWFRPW
jgi:hypothetical protein